MRDRDRNQPESKPLPDRSPLKIDAPFEDVIRAALEVKPPEKPKKKPRAKRKAPEKSPKTP